MLATLKGRVVAVSAAVTALSLIAVAGVTSLMNQRSAQASLEATLAQLSSANAIQIADWAASKRSVVDSLVPAASEADCATQLAAAATAGNFDDAYVGYDNKKAVFFQKRTRAADYDPTKRGWYLGAANDQRPFVSRPYTGAGSGKLTVTFSTPVLNAGKVVAVVAADVLMESVQKTLSQIKPTPSSVAFLVDDDGIVVAHPDSAAVLKGVQDIFAGLSPAYISRISAAGESIRTTVNGHDDYVLARRVESTPWRLVILVDAGEALAAVSAAKRASLAVVCVALLLTCAVLFGFLSLSMRSLANVRDALQEIASGDADLTKRLKVTGGLEIQQIATAFNTFVEVIADVLRQVTTASEQVMSGATELAGANQDLSARTERQAAALEQTSASTQALSGTVAQNSQHTSEAAALATSSIDTAERGRDTVLQISARMVEINQLAERIAEISDAVNGIAAQTNILALNAAVESARAGPAGRGFAVVASEVRLLSQRTAESARQISALATDARGRVESASALVQGGVSATTEIAKSAGQLSELLSTLAHAGNEQARGLNEVRQALAELDDVTQQNAALVEQSAAATEALAGQSAHLTATVGSFQV